MRPYRAKTNLGGLSLVLKANLATLLLKVPDSVIENHAYVLDDPENPLILTVATRSAHGQFVKIYWDVGKNSASQLAAQLEKNGRAKVYDLSFDVRSDVLHPESKKVLNAVAQAMRQHPDWKLGVEGHTDNIGGNACNLDLSKLRAAAVKQALVTQYIVASGRLSRSGSGASSPVETNDTIEGCARNRRVELARN